MLIGNVVVLGIRCSYVQLFVFMKLLTKYLFRRIVRILGNLGTDKEKYLFVVFTDLFFRIQIEFRQGLLWS